MKKSLKGLRYANTPKIINEYVNNHTFRCVFKKVSLHDMVLASVRGFFNYNYRKVLELSNFEEFNCPNLWKADDYIRHLKTIKRGCGNPNENFRVREQTHFWQIQDDLFDCKRPRDPISGVCRDVTKYLSIDRIRGKRLFPQAVRSNPCFIPISHVLEYREFWEDVDNDYLGLERDATEYPDLCMSSLKFIKGERAYYRKIRENRETQCIDLVKEYHDREDNPMSINLTYTEKYLTGGNLRNKNCFLIDRSRHDLVDWHLLSKDTPVN